MATRWAPVYWASVSAQSSEAPLHHAKSTWSHRRHLLPRPITVPPPMALRHGVQAGTATAANCMAHTLIRTRAISRVETAAGISVASCGSRSARVPAAALDALPLPGVARDGRCPGTERRHTGSGLGASLTHPRAQIGLGTKWRTGGLAQRDVLRAGKKRGVRECLVLARSQPKGYGPKWISWTYELACPRRCPSRDCEIPDAYKVTFVKRRRNSGSNFRLMRKAGLAVGMATGISLASSYLRGGGRLSKRVLHRKAKARRPY